MDGFSVQALSRCPLAEAVLVCLDHVCDSDFLNEIFVANRQSSRERLLTFENMVTVVRSAILEHGGSALSALKESNLEASKSAFYEKLSGIPLKLSEALLREGTLRVRELLPTKLTANIPTSLSEFWVGVVDGKKIKNVGKRLTIARRFNGGKLLGAKALVLFDMRLGMIVAAEGELDGERNDGPLVPGLMEQLKDAVPESRQLLVADSQYCDLTAPNRFRQFGGEVVVRYHPKTGFFPDQGRAEQHSVDGEERKVIEDWGVLGTPNSQNAFAARRIRVKRENQGDLILITTLLDADTYPANDILSVYFQRWNIETAFNKLSEVFSLLHVIGCNPRATFFQFSLCCLVYNIVQLIRHHLGGQQKLKPQDVSMQLLHIEIVKQLSAVLMFVDDDDLIAAVSHPESAKQRQQRITQLLNTAWKERFEKAPNKPRKRGRPPNKTTIPGGHTSVQRLIEKNT